MSTEQTAEIQIDCEVMDELRAWLIQRNHDEHIDGCWNGNQIVNDDAFFGGLLAEIVRAGYTIVATDRLERLVAAAVLGNDWYTNGVSSRSGYFVLPVRSTNVFDALQPGDLERPGE